ncbi:MAG: hypothetical protein FWE70_03065, partial [Oscillospiraceae bacterium]|nr:hypothetical protein [Oscillospiraceae bacterium]
AFDDEYEAYMGGRIPGHTNYMAVGEALSLSLLRDFTYLHPEVAEGRCTLGEGVLRLDNRVNWEEYRAVVLPDMDVVGLGTMRRLEAFAMAGGILVSTGRLPVRSAERGGDAELRSTVGRLFPARPDVPGSGRFACRAHGGAGRAYTLGVGGTLADRLRAALEDAAYRPDVEFTAVLADGAEIGSGTESVVEVWGGGRHVTNLPGGNLSYVHKALGGDDVYFVANSSDATVEAEVRLRGERALEEWDPHTGERRPARHRAGGGVTTLRITLPPVRSVFLVTA